MFINVHRYLLVQGVFINSAFFFFPQELSDNNDFFNLRFALKNVFYLIQFQSNSGFCFCFPADRKIFV